MELSIGQVALFSQNKIELTAFLSELFEAQPISVGENICVRHENFSFMIIDASDKEETWRSDTMIDFNVDTRETLEALLKRIEFIRYKNHLPESKSSNELLESSSGHYFFTCDPDGRKWKFTTRN